MAVKKITFDGGNVTANMDADINYLNSSKIAEGVFDLSFDGVNPLTITVANNNIYISKGYIEVYGRRILIEDRTSVYISMDRVAYGSVVVEIDLDSDSVELKAIEGTSSAYPTLTQENLFDGGKIYQFNICNFYKTTSSITTYNVTHTKIISPQDMLTFDNTPTSGSLNPVTSDGIYRATLGRKRYKHTFICSFYDTYQSKSILFHLSIINDNPEQILRNMGDDVSAYEQYFPQSTKFFFDSPNTLTYANTKFNVYGFDWHWSRDDELYVYYWYITDGNVPSRYNRLMYQFSMMDEMITEVI